MCIHICIYIYVYICIYANIYIYIYPGGCDPPPGGGCVCPAFTASCRLPTHDVVHRSEWGEYLQGMSKRSMSKNSSRQPSRPWCVWKMQCNVQTCLVTFWRLGHCNTLHTLELISSARAHTRAWRGAI